MASTVDNKERQRPIPIWLWAVLAALSLHELYELLAQPANRHLASLINVLLLIATCFAAVLLFIQATRRPDLPPELRRSLRWAMFPVLLQGCEGVVLLVVNLLGTLVVQDRSWENIPFVLADIFGQGSEVALLIALLKMPAAHKSQRGVVRTVIDALTFVVGAGIPLWLFSLRPLLAASSNADDLFTVTGPVVCFAGLLILSWALETRAVLPSRRAFKLILFSTGLLLLSDIMFSIGKASGLEYASLIKINYLLLSIGFGSWLVAGWCCTVDKIDTVERRPLFEFSPLPLLTIVALASYFMVLVLVGRPDPSIYPKLLAVLFLFLLILLARETINIRDTVKLSAAEAGQKTQARYEALVRHSTDVVLVLNDRQEIKFASPAVRSVLNVDPDSIIGRNLLDMVHPEDRVAGTAFLHRLNHEPAKAVLMQWRLALPGQSVRHLETIGSNLLNESEVQGIVLNSRDVSERRQMEEQLRQAQKMEAIGQLAGGVAHDFNNILTALQLQLELLRSEHAEVPSVVTGLDDLKLSAQRAISLTRQLLMFARKQMVVKETIELESLLGHLLKMLRRLIGENITIKFSPESPANWVKADAGMLEQVVMNLVVNARDAMKSGGKVTLTTSRVTLSDADLISHPNRRAGHFVCLAVTDTGHGMDAATRERIFEPFFTTKGQGRGTGLGLATVYGIVKQHEGWIEVVSTQDQGTTFTVFLPSSPAPELPAESCPEEAPAPASGKETVLLVEDDTAVRYHALTILRHAGYTVLVAESGAAALRAWKVPGSDQIKLLLTDMVMPGELSGLELGLQLRQERPDLRVVVMSGYSQELSDHGLNPSDNIAFLAKPFDGAGLLRTVRQALNSG